MNRFLTSYGTEVPIFYCFCLVGFWEGFGRSLLSKTTHLHLSWSVTRKVNGGKARKLGDYRQFRHFLTNREVYASLNSKGEDSVAAVYSVLLTVSSLQSFSPTYTIQSGIKS